MEQERIESIEVELQKNASEHETKLKEIYDKMS